MGSIDRGWVFLGALTALLTATRPTAAAPEHPNIVVFLADDLGNADLGHRGGKATTPNIDALATGGARLESFYGQPVCTPSRAALMTGRYPMREGLQTLVIFPAHTYGLPLDERTLGEELRDGGYVTWMVGKWHLGHAERKFWPQNRGFDHFYGNVVGEVDYFTHERGGVVDWQRDGVFLKEEGYYTELIGNEAVKLVEGYDGSKPFFLYFASLAPHAPYQVPPSYLDRFPDVSDPIRRTYLAMIAALDDQVGRVVAAVAKKGWLENTVFVFASDNGGATNSLFATGARSPEERESSGGVALGEKPPADNGVFRAGKGSIYEGGLRVPAFVSWAGHLQPRIVSEPLGMVDLFPTLLGLAGVKPSGGKPLDGRDAWATIARGAPSPHDDLLLDVEVFRGAIRRGRWKLVKVATLPGKTELYDLDKDPGETKDVAASHPEIVKDLEQRLVAYSREQKPSEWIKAQPGFLGAQGRTVFDQDFDVDDGGLAQEKPALPAN